MGSGAEGTRTRSPQAQLTWGHPSAPKFRCSAPATGCGGGGCGMGSDRQDLAQGVYGQVGVATGTRHRSRRSPRAFRTWGQPAAPKFCCSATASGCGGGGCGGQARLCRSGVTGPPRPIFSQTKPARRSRRSKPTPSAVSRARATPLRPWARLLPWAAPICADVGDFGSAGELQLSASSTPFAQPHPFQVRSRPIRHR